MLQRGIAVLDEGDVHLEERAALRHHQQILGPRRGDHLLALVAARLVVILDRMGALQPQPADMIERVGIGIDQRIAARRAGAVDDLARGEGARAKDDAGALHLAGGEDLGRRARRIVHGGDAHGNKTLNHDAENVSLACKSSVEECQPRRH